MEGLSAKETQAERKENGSRVEKKLQDKGQK